MPITGVMAYQPIYYKVILSIYDIPPKEICPDMGEI